MPKNVGIVQPQGEAVIVWTVGTDGRLEKIRRGPVGGTRNAAGPRKTISRMRKDALGEQALILAQGMASARSS